MNYSSNEMILNGGSSTNLNASCDAVGSAAASAGNRSVLKELNTNGSNAMLGPLSPPKAASNSSKLLAASSLSNTSKISATAAGSANFKQFENNSLSHELYKDAEATKDNEQQQQQQQQQEGAKDQLNDSGVNTLSNKFIGLTEFDEAKIPELPCDLNPNIEEQYNVTFEECFIPTLKAQQSLTVTDVPKDDKTQTLLSSEADFTSSDNETFTDCYDERDPLTPTFAEPASLDITELESFQSAGNRTLSTTFSNTMENIADITMEAEGHPLKNINKIKLVEEPPIGQTVQEQFEPMDEDEPMDVDMNATMEIIPNTSNNIQNVQKVLQHAENILQDLEDKKISVVEDREKESDTDKLPAVENALEENSASSSKHMEMEHYSTYNESVDKSLELPVNKAKSLSLEIMESVNKEASQEENMASEEAKNKSDNNLKLTNNLSNCSNMSKSPAHPAVDSETETKLNLSLSLNASKNSQKSSASNSPSFPITPPETAGFPHSPKAATEKQAKPLFLEKSDYLTKLEEKFLNSNDTLVQCSSNSEAKNLNGNLEEAATLGQDNKRRTFSIDTTMTKVMEKQEKMNMEFKSNPQTSSINTLNEEKITDGNCRTFDVKTNDNVSMQLIKFPSIDNPEIDQNKRRTFSLNVPQNIPNETVLHTEKNDMISRRTFNIPSKDVDPQSTNHHTELNASYEAMEVDDHISENATLPLISDEKQKSQSPLPNIQQESPSSLPVINQKAQSQLEESEQLSSIMKTNPQICLPTFQSSFQQTAPAKSQSPSLPIMQPPRAYSPPLPAMRSRPQAPPIPTIKPKTQSYTLSAECATKNKCTPPEPIAHERGNVKQEHISPPPPDPQSNSTLFIVQPLSTLIQKRPSIRDARARAADILSAKERSNIKVKDEKDVLVEKSSSSSIEDILPAVSAASDASTNSSGLSEFDQTSSSSSSSSIINNGEQQTKESKQIEDDFRGNNLILNPSDFDYLLTKGNNNTPVDRSSLLLKFDPLLGIPVPVNQGQPQQQQLPINNNNPYLSPTLEEDEHNDSNQSFVIVSKAGVASAKLSNERSQEVKQQLQQLEQQQQLQQQVQQNKRQLTQGAKKKNATMSVDVIKDMSLDNDCNKAFENSNSTQSDDKQINYKMDELEKKIKNEVLKTEDIEKKLKDAEQREEALIKRITEKDKTIAKMTGVIEAYEKAIAELIADKEQLTQHYEKQLAEVKGDRDSNYHHLTSLETTFSDLHVKYEKSKEMTCQLKESEETLQAEKRKNLENLHLQEQRYDKMKNHAMQQLEIANKKLESLTREHSIEITKLKALLKKEEIARSSINEQLSHKTKENAELVKICDELISGQGSNFSFEPFDPKKH